MASSDNVGSPGGASDSPQSSASVSGSGASGGDGNNAAASSCPARATVTDVTTITVTAGAGPVAGGGTTQCPAQQTQVQTSVLTSTLSCPASVANTLSTPSGQVANCTREDQTGKLAGAAIGAAVGAALIAVLVTALLCRRKRRPLQRKPRMYTSNDIEPLAMTGSRKTGFSMAEKERPRHGRTSLLISHLPQPADDDSLRNAVKTLFNQIELHVDNYYSRTGRVVDVDIKSRVDDLDSTKLPRPLAQMLADSKSVNSTLKHCIGYLVISMLAPNTQQRATLLPSRLSVLPPRLKTSSSDSQENLVLREAYSQWKILSAYLFPNVKDDQAYQNDQEQAENDIADRLESTLGPWENESADKVTMHQNIKGIAKTAAGLGLIIVSQPTTYEFAWDTNRSPRTVVIFPAFRKTSDERGRPLGAAQLLVPQKEM